MKSINLKLMLLVIAAIAAGCANTTKTDDQAAVAARVEAQLQRDDRGRFDKPKDPHRRPIAMVKFLGVQSGMTALDVGSAAGYSAEILSAAVGPGGHVYAQNNARATRLQDGKFIASLRRRAADDRLPNLEIVIWEMDAMPLENSVDIAFWGNNLHDYYNREGEEVTLKILRTIRKTMKNGAILGIVDHVGVAGANNVKLHRIEPSVLEELIQKAGFKIIATSNMYQNPNDKHDLNVFNDAIYRATDRHFVKAVK